MESQFSSAVQTDTSVQESFDSVLQNPLIVKKICSFTTAAELLNLRLINGLFHDKATRRLSKINHKPINLGIQRSSTGTVENFVALMKIRIDPEDFNSFPFSSFKLDLWQSANTIEYFAAEVGLHVRRLHLYGPDSASEEINHQLYKKLVSILSRVPNLTEIEFMTHKPIQLANADLAVLSQSFPQLRVIDVDHMWLSRIPPNSTSLLSLLISRATRLLDEVRTVRISASLEENPCQGLTALRTLSKHHKAHLPVVHRGLITMLPHSLPIVQELNNMKLSFKNLNTVMGIPPGNFTSTAGLQNLLWNFSDFLATQNFGLDTLSFLFSLWSPPETVTLTVPIPPLAALTEFRCHIMVNVESNNAPLTTLSIPLTPNQFPALQFFQLDLITTGPNATVRFAMSPQPSVQEFELLCSKSLIIQSNPWHIIFPNLSCMSIYFRKYRVVLDDLRYILTHFPRLTSLNLYFDPDAYTELDQWDTLTAGAPRPLSTDVLLQGVLNQEVGNLEDPIDSIYQTASLSNFRALQTLKCRPGSRGNLNAIVYMTRIGRLGPLNKLVIVGILCDLRMEDEERTMYRDLLAQVHTDVSVLDGLEERIIRAWEMRSY